MKSSQQWYRHRNAHFMGYFGWFMLATSCYFIIQSMKSSEIDITDNNQCLNELYHAQSINTDLWRVDTIHIGTDYIVMKLPQETVTMVNSPILKSHASVLVAFKQDSITDYSANTILILNLLNGEPNVLPNSEISSENGNKICRREIENSLGCDNKKYDYVMDYNGAPFQVMANNVEMEKTVVIKLILSNIKILRNQPYRIDNRRPRFIVKKSKMDLL